MIQGRTVSGLPRWLSGKKKISPVNAGDSGDMGPIPGSGRSLGEGNGNPLQYSCLENSLDQGAWWYIVHGVVKSKTNECEREGSSQRS